MLESGGDDIVVIGNDLKGRPGPRPGAFEITLQQDGTVLFSKLMTGRRPNRGDMATIATYLTNLIEKRAGGAGTGQQQEDDEDSN